MVNFVYVIYRDENGTILETESQPVSQKLMLLKSICEMDIVAICYES